MTFIPEITYLYHRNPFSIRTKTPSEKKKRCFEYIFKEITDSLIPGKRISETVRWAYLFGSLYVSFYDSPEFQRIYHIYHRELSDGKQRSALYRLTMIHFLTKNKVGRLLLKIYMKYNYLVQIIKDISIGTKNN